MNDMMYGFCRYDVKVNRMSYLGFDKGKDLTIRVFTLP
jgi:hypothetical protein